MGLCDPFPTLDYTTWRGEAGKAAGTIENLMRMALCAGPFPRIHVQQNRFCGRKHYLP